MQAHLCCPHPYISTQTTPLEGYRWQIQSAECCHLRPVIWRGDIGVTWGGPRGEGRQAPGKPGPVEPAQVVCHSARPPSGARPSLPGIPGWLGRQPACTETDTPNSTCLDAYLIVRYIYLCRANIITSMPTRSVPAHTNCLKVWNLNSVDVFFYTIFLSNENGK